MGGSVFSGSPDPWSPPQGATGECGLSLFHHNPSSTSCSRGHRGVSSNSSCLGGGAWANRNGLHACLGWDGWVGALLLHTAVAPSSFYLAIFRNLWTVKNFISVPSEWGVYKRVGWSPSDCLILASRTRTVLASSAYR